MIVQAVLPCLLFAAKKSTLRMKGGTNVDMAPPINYLTEVFSSFAQKFGIHFSCNLLKRWLIFTVKKNNFNNLFICYY